MAERKSTTVAIHKDINRALEDVCEYLRLKKGTAIDQAIRYWIKHQLGQEKGAELLSKHGIKQKL